MSIVFYENLLYLCIGKINNNRYEAKTRYTSLSDNRGYYGAISFNDSVSSMQYAWNTNEFDSISYGHRICHTKTTTPSLHYLVDAIPPSLLISVKKCVSKKTQPLAYSPTSNNEEVQKKRLELFHYEYQREQQQYQWQKEREEDEKLNAILRYTRDTFKRFDLEEIEIYQICESVRYFAINRQVLSATEIHIKKRTSLTQISLKNFAWNIAFQYNIGRDMTTSFVMATFAEWFANSTFDTVRKNLRTTTGRHKIEIDENILAKYNVQTH